MISMFNRMRENDKGFTLVELLVVIVILGILIAIAVPTFLSQQNKANGAKVETYLNTAYKDAKAYAVDYNGNFTDASASPAATPATLASSISNSEPELGTVPVVTATDSATVKAALSSANPIGVVNATSGPTTSGNDLELVGLADDGDVYTLTVTGNGAPVVAGP